MGSILTGEWYSARECLPPFGRQVLVRCEVPGRDGGVGDAYLVAVHDGVEWIDGNSYMRGDFPLDETVTHWQMFVKLGKQQKQEKE